MVDVFFDPRMVADGGGYSPSGSKSGQVVDDWLKRDLEIRIEGFDLVDREDICLVHDPAVVHGILDLRLRNGHGTKSRNFSDSLPWVLGSHLAASISALSHGVACSPTSGFHHAHWGGPSGFCTFNGLMLSAVKLLRKGMASRVAIWDLDYHEPDGCDDIIDTLRLGDRVKTFTNSYTSLADVAFREMREHILGLNKFQPDLLMYQAGADMFIDDPLGGAMTIEELKVRDRIVFEWCADNRVPVVWNLAGGYTREKDGSIPKVLEIHRNTMEVAVDVFGKVAV
jgi:acetoin utilization deacetylase AcuC-like enzyme